MSVRARSMISLPKWTPNNNEGVGPFRASTIVVVAAYCIATARLAFLRPLPSGENIVRVKRAAQMRLFRAASRSYIKRKTTPVVRRYKSSRLYRLRRMNGRSCQQHPFESEIRPDGLVHATLIVKPTAHKVCLTKHQPREISHRQKSRT